MKSKINVTLKVNEKSRIDAKANSGMKVAS
jgi:hypothetical protein